MKRIAAPRLQTDVCMGPPSHATASAKAAPTSSSRPAVGVRAVQVEHEPLGVRPLRELAELGRPAASNGDRPAARALLGQREHEPVVAAMLLEHLLDLRAGEDPPVPGYDDVRREAGQPVQGGKRPGHRAHEHQRRQSGEHEVAGEQHALGRQPGHEVTGRVRRAARMQQVDPAVADVHGQGGRRP